MMHMLREQELHGENGGRRANWCTRDYKLSVWDSPVESAIRAFSNRNHLCSLLNLS